MSYPALRAKVAAAGSRSDDGHPGDSGILGVPVDLRPVPRYGGPAIATVVLRLCHSRSPGGQTRMPGGAGPGQPGHNTEPALGAAGQNKGIGRWQRGLNGTAGYGIMESRWPRPCALISGDPRGARATSMNQLRLDPLTGRWVVVSTDRAHRPQAFAPRVAAIQADTSRPCPFCPGNEESATPALETARPRRQVAGPGGPQPLPGLRGQCPLRGHQPGPGVHPGHRRRDPRGDRAVARATRTRGRC